MRGIAEITLVGSVARAIARADSDIDLVIELGDSASFSPIDHASVRSALEEWLGVSTDVLIWEDLEPEMRDRLARDRIDIF